MKPYYSDEAAGIVLYHGDCREVLSATNPVGIGMLLADPPYGIGLCNNDKDGHRRKESYSIHNDDSEEVARFILGRAEEYEWTTAVFASPWNPWPGDWRNLIVWDKGGAVGGGGDISTCLKRSWELIQIARNGPMNGRRDESVWRVPITPDDTRLHIAAKPVGLLARLIRRFAPPVGSIFDPCCGSGSTLVAAKEQGRQAVGIELDEGYCETAAKRLSQGVLFGVGGAA